MCIRDRDSGATRTADTSNQVDLATHQEVLDELDQLKYHLQSTETRCTTSRRELSASQEQCTALHAEVSNLTQQLRGMDAVIRSVEAAANAAAPPSESSATTAATSIASGIISPTSSAAGTSGRVAAKIVFEGGASRSPRPSTSVDSNSRGRRGSTVQGGLPLLDFASLPDRNIKNPNPREKKLLDRLDTVERYALSLADYDISRQRSYDELERNRADLFAYLNESNQAQHEKIQTLQKSVGTRDKRIAELEATMEHAQSSSTAAVAGIPATDHQHHVDVASPVVSVSKVSTPQQTPHQWSTSTSTQFTDSNDMKKQVETFGLPSDAGAQARLIAKIHILEQRELQSEALLKMLRIHHESVLVRSAEFCQMVIDQSAMLGNELSTYKAATAASVDAGEVKSARHHLLHRLSMRLKVHPANPVYGVGGPKGSDTRSSRESLHTAEDGIVNDSLYSNPVDSTPLIVQAESAPQEDTPAVVDVVVPQDAPVDVDAPVVDVVVDEDVHVPDEDPFPMASSSPSGPPSDPDDHDEEEEARCGGFIPLDEDTEDVSTTEQQPHTMPVENNNAQADDGWGTFQQVTPPTHTSSPTPVANHDFDPFA
eukprot:TRINITY_DN5626_c0_g1_i2.p1 TRINITY_DN5626_c0_g1~~TRINITY_DN5626_c0_g1_i2.p1  ORF type:complete len:599 (-),score=90.73 TRINITY_DN5626_c0_g1_i2:34-1830(-)